MSLGIVEVVPRGVSLPLVGAAVVAALVLQLAGTLRVRPTPAALRAAFVAGARGPRGPASWPARCPYPDGPPRRARTIHPPWRETGR